jgi:hypothetical protein
MKNSIDWSSTPVSEQLGIKRLRKGFDVRDLNQMLDLFGALTRNHRRESPLRPGPRAVDLLVGSWPGDPVILYARESSRSIWR